MVVCKSGCDYFVRDLEEDVKEVVKVRRLELILTFLGSVILLSHSYCNYYRQLTEHFLNIIRCWCSSDICDK